MQTDSSRRQFLLQSVTGLSAVWLSSNWPALLSAAEHARHQAASVGAKKLEFFTSEQAAEVEAVSARIIPADDTPGAREAGVVYFIDRALVAFAKDQQQTFREGLPALHSLTKNIFPQYSAFSQATPAEQDQILQRFGHSAAANANVPPASHAAQTFFETLRWLTVAGFLLDPDTRGNPDGIGWKLIGRERAHAFQAPFGYYDKDYPGFQIVPAAAKQGGDA